MPSLVNSKSLLKTLNKKPIIIKFILLNGCLSLFCLVLVATGSMKEKRYQFFKYAESIASIFFAASGLIQCYKLDNTEEAEEYLLHLNQSAFKAEADAEISMIEYKAKQRTQVEQFQFIEDEFKSNAHYKYLQEFGVKALDQQEEEEGQVSQSSNQNQDLPFKWEEETAPWDEPSTDAIKKEINKNQFILTDVHFKQIAHLTNEGVKLPQAIYQVTGISQQEDEEEWKKVLEELRKRV